LIDYFHDMTLLKNRTDDSINFQKASFTLDGCVKIWTSRVDSVGTETGKLLSNLADDGREDHDEEGDEEGGEDGDVQGERMKKRKVSTVTYILFVLLLTLVL
jgi:condensin complex subunit 2